jgi:hypothetical protein
MGRVNIVKQVKIDGKWILRSHALAGCGKTSIFRRIRNPFYAE